MKATDFSSLWRLGVVAAILACVAACTSVGPDSASPEQVVRRFWSAFNRAAWNELDGLAVSSYRHHTDGGDLTLAQFKEGGTWVHHGLAHYDLHIDALVVQGELVAIRWTARGQHEGSMFGETPTHREIVTHGMHFMRVVSGKVAEDWEVIDFGEFRRQLTQAP